ncbi:hypothetical protein [Roseiterribacter gracilis]|uniref:Uncharacterized protein n=1 Tax=Roseiterribacter gracilis TaxID=2812848 RepID=A0A8S8X9E4_9PROT|nr:hypothetical protein TMPK1_23400 [Rhodospirillales bacterium TMPK1]
MIRTCMVALVVTGFAATALAQSDSESRCATYRTEADRAECVRTQALNEAAKTPTSWTLTEPPAVPVPVETSKHVSTTYETGTSRVTRTLDERVTDSPATGYQEKTTTVTKTTR